ncbi:MAG: hypothetical protein IT321_31015 [Anaerolineae bacterium]|nr:hypothetical protein [Anaerolineae bacterium]
MPTTWTIAIDWDRNGNYTGTYDDISDIKTVYVVADFAAIADIKRWRSLFILASWRFVLLLTNT